MMLFFYAVALPLVVCTVVYGLVWLPSPSTGLLVRLDVGLAWGAALATLILVPTDVATTLLGGSPPQLATWWRATYWYGFFVMVLVLPIHMEHTRRGEFSALDRALGAVRYHLVYYCALVGVAAAGILLLLLAGRLEARNILGFCIASSNAYGLIGAIFLMGYGLVAIPRQLWRCADLADQLQRCCHELGALAERCAAANLRLSTTVLTARRASVLFGAHDPLRPCVDTVLALAESTGPGFRPNPAAVAALDDSPELDIFDLADLAALRRRLKTDLKDHEREAALFRAAAERGLRLEASLAARADAASHGPSFATEPGLRGWLQDAAVHFWAYRILAVLAGAASLVVILAETTIPASLPNLSAVSWALGAAGGARFPTAATCMLALAYPCACANYSLYRLGQVAFYRMVPGHTDSYSLCYSALLVSRFASPLAFNFMAAVALPQGRAAGPDVTDTVFYAEFGRLMMQQPLIGWRFTAFAPAALAPYCLVLALGLFNPLARLLQRGGSLQFEDDWEDGSGVAARGRRLLRVEGQNRQNGLPLGLTIDPAINGSGAASRPGPPAPAERAPWWRRLAGGREHDDHGFPSPPPPNLGAVSSGEAARSGAGKDARARLWALVAGRASPAPEAQSLLRGGAGAGSSSSLDLEGSPQVGQAMPRTPAQRDIFSHLEVPGGKGAWKSKYGRSPSG
ncbi:hypothetical protein ACKKBF_B38030 [Auxenochlorella protothecoides x Auxenochlorella symbiontica]